ncbi:hypothetical protein [Ureibacillus thermophilus]|uniref:Antigen I/II N-terminal domain-containing protein n=1 Tax=Ureibacillus thermophilus TaxID=367743 RepID=A0A4P6UTC8_9BACL|nr:hypothetical protein [Ureibacillus thermophilus]QBK25785.1 hypothetical protein DKZ56_07870 [Ureibacillus thermophilus]
MKKLIFAALLLLIALLTACNADEEGKANEAQQQEKETDSEGINVDKGLFNVEVTLPASFFEGGDIDQSIAEAEKEGIEVTKNEDGSLTYKMSKTKHKEMMSEMKTSLLETIEDLKNGEDFASIKDVEYNKDFSEFTLWVDRNDYENSFDGFAVFGLGLSGAMYQLFDGADPENYNVRLVVKDEATKEIIGEANYPKDLEKMEE